MKETGQTFAFERNVTVVEPPVMNISIFADAEYHPFLSSTGGGEQSGITQEKTRDVEPKVLREAAGIIYQHGTEQPSQDPIAA